MTIDKQAILETAAQSKRTTTQLVDGPRGADFIDYTYQAGDAIANRRETKYEIHRSLGFAVRYMVRRNQGTLQRNIDTHQAAAYLYWSQQVHLIDSHINLAWTRTK